MQNTFLSFEPTHGQNVHFSQYNIFNLYIQYSLVYLFCFLHKETYWGKAHDTHWHCHRTCDINGWTFNFSTLSFCCAFLQENVEEFPGMSAVQNRKREIYHDNQMHFQNGCLSIKTLEMFLWWTFTNYFQIPYSITWCFFVFFLYFTWILHFSVWDVMY